MIVLFDNYDSFTYNLADLFLQKGLELKVVRNNEWSLLDIISLNPEAIVISPGPGRPEESGILMELIQHFHDKIPLLGVCLGHQAIAQHFGARLVHASRCMHGKVSTIQHTHHAMFDKVEQHSEMMRYHSLIIEHLPECLEPTAYTQEHELMGFAHRHLAIWGVQFHPESILSKNGPQIIDNWLTHFQLIKPFGVFC